MCNLDGCWGVPERRSIHNPYPEPCLNARDLFRHVHFLACRPCSRKNDKCFLQRRVPYIAKPISRAAEVE